MPIEPNENKIVYIYGIKRVLFIPIGKRLRFTITSGHIMFHGFMGYHGRVDFNEIEKITVRKYNQVVAVMIELKKPRLFEAKLNELNRGLSRRFNEKFGVSVVIFPKQIEISVEDLFSILQDRQYGISC